MRRRQFVAGLGSAVAWPLAARARQGERVRALEQRNELSGIGIDFAMENGLIKVVTPIDEMPAAKAGIMANDIITKLDDEQVQGLTLQQAAEKMRGPVGTKIKLTIVRRGHDEPIDVSITRDVIRMSREGADLARSRVAQQPRSFPRIGFLSSESTLRESWHLIVAFMEGLKETGYSIGDERNVDIEFRIALGHFDSLPALAADLVRREVAVIAASDLPATEAVQAAATTIPIVWMSYQGSNADSYRTAGVYVGRILKGERPTDLPVMPPR
jgi:PDZ domain